MLCKCILWLSFSYNNSSRYRLSMISEESKKIHFHRSYMKCLNREEWDGVSY